jgi:CRP-like cAMP-binding protein
MSEPTGNLLLDSLPREVRDRIKSTATLLDLPARTTLGTPDKLPTYVYFLTGGLASLVARMAEGGSAEVGMYGKEGLVGVNALLGPMPEHAETFMQITGTALRIPVPAARALFESLPDFRRAVLAHVQEQLITAAQVTACNKLHDAESRLARWLLMVSDRIQGDTLGLTQEFLAEMLGTQRSTVALVAGQLQDAGTIAYSRGVVRILDRGLLQKRACECYRVAKQAFDVLYR